MSEIIDRDVKTKEKFGKEAMLSNISKKLEKSKAEIIEKIPENEELSIIIMEIRGTIYVEGHI